MISENALKVLQKRYFLKDKNGKIKEDYEGLCQRVAQFLFPDNEQYRSMLQRYMEHGIFLPNSPTLMNAGKPNGQLSACFVLPIEDNMESIFDTLKETAMIHKSGGGTGFDFSKLRPKNSIVNSTHGVASGPVSFMKVYNAATEAVKQGGTRRGANMGVLRVDHPDILEFITCKDDTKEITNFNISVGITDEFMRRVIEEKDYELVHDGVVYGELNANEVLDLIIDRIHTTGEPGILFLDTINDTNPNPELGKIAATNPCGEIPLLPNESCNLGSINVAKLQRLFPNELQFENQLITVSKVALHALNSVLDKNTFPNEKIKESTLKTRKVGLGIMGFADYLIQKGIEYGSQHCTIEIGKIMKCIKQASVGFENSTITTIAPTGTLSLIAGCSSGIEPLYSLVFERHQADEIMTDVYEPFLDAAKAYNFYSDDLIDNIIQNGGSCVGLPQVPKSFQKIFVTAHDVVPPLHVKVQSEFQKYVDNSISKTINLPEDYPKGNLFMVIQLAWVKGCKGLTLYRNNSRFGQTLQIQKHETKQCPDCGHENKVIKNLCNLCESCGSSRCSG